jgi:hypothetical protein
MLSWLLPPTQALFYTKLTRSKPPPPKGGGQQKYFKIRLLNAAFYIKIFCKASLFQILPEGLLLFFDELYINILLY